MVAFCYSKDALSRKPKNPAPYQRKENYQQEELSIEEIAKLCGTGHCWRAGIYDLGNGTFKKKEVKAAQVIALDFDKSEHSPHEVIEYAFNVGLPVSFWYPSFSQDPRTLTEKRGPKSAAGTVGLINISNSHTVPNGDFEHVFECKSGWNYRLVWCLVRQISPREYETVYAAIQDLFDRYSPDRSTKDCSRLWYGGKLGYEVLNSEPLPLSALGAITAHSKVREGVEPNKAMKQKKGFIPDYQDMPSPDAVEVGEGWQSELQGRCMLWDKWSSGEYLDYNERIALFSNLRYLKHSNNRKSILKDVLSYYNPKVYAGHTCDEEQIRTKFRDSSLKPFPIVKGLLGVPQTVPEFFSSNPDAPIIPTTQKVSIETLDKWLDKEIPAFLADRQGGVKILKSQTGSGKTQRIIDYVLSSIDLERSKVIYAAPKHSNLKEVEQRLLAKAKPYQFELIKRCPEKEITASDLLYMNLGLPARTRSAKRKGFIDELYSEDTTGIYLMTHSLLTALSGLQPVLIIIDEEIDSSLVKETKLSLTNLSTVIPYLDKATANELVDFMDDVKRRTREDGIDIDVTLLRDKVAPMIEEQVEDYIASTQSGLLAVGLFETYWVEKARLSKDSSGNNCLRFVRKSTLIDDAALYDVPVRVFTATPLHKRTEQYYSQSIEVTEAPLAENKGRLIQYSGISGARGSSGQRLDKLNVICSYVKQVLPQDVIDRSLLITFKGSKEEQEYWAAQGFTLASEDGKQIHLMNNSGLDCFKGKSLIIAGKLDKPLQSYQDEYDDCHSQPKELTRQNQVIELNGVRQTLYLFDDKEMREQQLQFIQSITEQAAGRARALREGGATVYLFSNLVIADADEVRER